MKKQKEEKTNVADRICSICGKTYQVGTMRVCPECKKAREDKAKKARDER